MSKKMSNLSQETIRRITTALAQVSPLFNELIPAFTTRYEERISQCIARALKQKGAITQMSVIFCEINRVRPFPSGNKRIALALLLYMLHENKLWLNVQSEKLYNFANWVSTAPKDAEEELISYTEKFINKHKVNLKKGKKVN